MEPQQGTNPRMALGPVVMAMIDKGLDSAVVAKAIDALTNNDHSALPKEARAIMQKMTTQKAQAGMNSTAFMSAMANPAVGQYAAPQAAAAA